MTLLLAAVQPGVRQGGKNSASDCDRDRRWDNGQGRCSDLLEVRRGVGPQQAVRAAVGGIAVPRHRLPPVRAQ